MTGTFYYTLSDFSFYLYGSIKICRKIFVSLKIIVEFHLEQFDTYKSNIPNLSSCCMIHAGYTVKAMQFSPENFLKAVD